MHALQPVTLDGVGDVVGHVPGTRPFLRRIGKGSHALQLRLLQEVEQLLELVGIGGYTACTRSHESNGVVG